MTIEEALVMYLKSTAAVTALIGAGVSARIYPEVAPQKAAYPRLTYQLIDCPQLMDLRGPVGIAYPRVQVDAWTQNKADAVALATAVRRADGGVPGQKLDGLCAKIGDIMIWLCTLVDRTYSSEPLVHGEEYPVRRASLDFQIWHSEV